MKRKTQIVSLLIVIGLLWSAYGIAAQQSPPHPEQPQQPGQPEQLAQLEQPPQPAQPPQPQQPGPAPVPPMSPMPAVPPVPPVPRADPLADVIFPPDLIMRNARMLELTGEQKTFMREEIQRTSTRFNDLQWQLQDAMELLHDNLESSSVNEQQALSQLDKVLDIERQIKHLHVGMGIRIKNRLTPEQQTKLHNARMPSHQATPMPGVPRQPGS